jgi:hypothetical protein
VVIQWEAPEVTIRKGITHSLFSLVR